MDYLMDDSQLVYVTLDLRRGLWVSETLGAKIVCAYKSDLLIQMRKQGADIWCFEESFPRAELPTSSFRLLSDANTLKMLQSVGKNLEFIVFKPSSRIKRWIENNGWELLSSAVSTCKGLEDKLDFGELAVSEGILMPNFKEVLWNEEQVDEWHEEFGDVFVVQGRMGHAGSSSFIKRTGEELSLASGTRVKISAFVKGDSYTVNGYVDATGKMAYGQLWKQLMNVEDWNSAELGTVGISAVNREELAQIDLPRLQKKLSKISKVFSKTGYRGFFGLDLIWNGELWYMIECNARLTASISLQTEQDKLCRLLPLLALHANKSVLDTDDFRFLEGVSEYSQVIFRNTRKRAWKTPRFLKSGIYQLNEQKVWVLKSRKFQLRLLQVGEMMLLLSRSPESLIQAEADYATVITKGPLHSRYEALLDDVRDFYERVVLGHVVRNKALWQDRFVRMQNRSVDPVFVLQRPVPNYEKADKQVLRKYRQVEVLDGEVLQLRAKYEDFWLVERVDGTRGWLHKSYKLIEGVNADEFVFPGKLSKQTSEFLKSWQGTPYLWGGNTKKGIDCSAFVQRFFWEVRGVLLPKYSQDQKARTLRVDRVEDLADEDLVFMRSQQKGIAHVGIVSGGKIWHSSLETGVVVQSMDELMEKYAVEHVSRLVEDGKI